MKWYYLRNREDGEIADIFAHNVKEAKLKCALLLGWAYNDCTERKMNKI